MPVTPTNYLPVAVWAYRGFALHAGVCPSSFAPATPSNHPSLAGLLLLLQPSPLSCPALPCQLHLYCCCDSELLLLLLLLPAVVACSG
jgi:hypothetical protein